MNFISRDTDYAWRALMFMTRTQEKKLFNVEEIVEEEKLPERFLRRILQKLAKKDILISNKGKNGGFSFSRPSSKITLTDIIEIFQGKVDLTNCFLKGARCPNIKKNCSVRKKLKKISKVLEDELKKITIVSSLRG